MLSFVNSRSGRFSMEIKTPQLCFPQRPLQSPSCLFILPQLCNTVVAPTLTLFWVRIILQKQRLEGKVGYMKARGNKRFKKHLHKHVKEKYVCST